MAESPVIFAETARLRLRGEAAGDFETWLKHINTPEVTEHLGGPRASDRVAADFARMAEPGEFPWMFIALKTDNTLLGKCGLGRIETAAAPDALRGQVEVGWTIRADYWRRGYGREAALALLDMAFGRYGLPVVHAQTSERNGASWRLMESLGLRRVPHLVYDDPDYAPEENPTIVFAIERERWTTGKHDA
jgi:RimJ/RimL family protein N-acetyltransferase